MSETAAASETLDPAAAGGGATVTEPLTTDTPKPEKAPALEDILAEPGDEIDPKKLRKSALQERFSELTTKQKEAAARADAAERELQAIRDREAEAARQEQARRDAAPRPRREEFDDPDAYDQALITWTENKAKREGAESERAKYQAEAAARESASIRDVFATRVAEFKAIAPDFEQVAYAKDLPMTDVMALTIQRMENGPAVAYHLGQNTAVAAKLAQMAPAAQLFELGRLSATVATQKAAAVSKAPPPIEPVGSRSGASKDISAMTGDEYYEYREAQRAAARKR